MTLALLLNIASVVGVLSTATGLLFAVRQLRAQRNIARMEFLLRIYDMMQQFNDVHGRLVFGNWVGSGPATDEEWARVDRYMGLFEPIQIVVEDGIVNIEAVDTLVGHRVVALATNAAIIKRNLTDRKYRWGKFIALCDALKDQQCFRSIVEKEVRPAATPARAS